MALLPGPLCLGMTLRVSVSSVGQIDLFNILTACKQMLN